MPGKFGLCPDSLDPNDTVLAGMGANRTVEGAVWKPEGGGTIGDKNVLTVINDKYMVFGGSSNGPNGVLTDCQEKYGSNRINLFYHNENKTKKLLNDYLTLRNNELDKIFHLFVDEPKRSNVPHKRLPINCFGHQIRRIGLPIHLQDSKLFHANSLLYPKQ